MKKVKVLFSAAAIVAIIAAFAATAAQHKIYVQDPLHPENPNCTLQLTGRTLVPNTSGVFATLIPGPCPDKYFTPTVIN